MVKLGYAYVLLCAQINRDKRRNGGIERGDRRENRRGEQRRKSVVSRQERAKGLRYDNRLPCMDQS